MPAPTSAPPRARLIYAAGLVQGLVLVGPAGGGQVLRPAIGDARYGAIFLPLVIGAVAGALAAPAASRWRGARATLALGFALNVVASLTLAASALVLDSPGAAFVVLLAACALIGLGFGLSIAALNVLAIEAQPARSATAVAALHMTLGVGSLIGPLIVGVLAGWEGAGALGDGPWWLSPLAAGAAAAGVLAVLGGVGRERRTMTVPEGMTMRDLPPRLLAYAAIAVVYGAIEALYINWTTIYVREDLGGTDAIAGLGLSLFFGAMAGVRLAFALLALRRPLRSALVLSPVAAAGAFALTGLAGSPAIGLVGAALAGATLAPFFVYLLSLAAAEFSARRTTVSGLMMAALMGGSGGSAVVVGILRSRVELEATFLAAGGISLALALAVAVLRPGPRARV